MLLLPSPPGSQPEALQAPGRAQKGFSATHPLYTLCSPQPGAHLLTPLLMALLHQRGWPLCPKLSHFHPCQPTTNKEIILKHLSGVPLGSETYASSCSVPPSK